jgi:hypothetical protein
MRQPLALLFYEHLLTGHQLLNRLRDLEYRTQVVSEVDSLPEEVLRAQPLVLFVELGAQGERLCAMIRALKTAAETRHLPVFAWQEESRSRLARRLAREAQQAGATVLPQGRGMLAQLPLLLDQALDRE